MAPSKEREGEVIRAPDLEIVGDQVRLQPGGFTADPETYSGITERKLVPKMGRFRENPFEFLRELSLFVSGTGWRAYDNFIGQPIYYSGYSDKMRTSIFNNPLLVGKISELADRQVNSEEKNGLLSVGAPVEMQKKGVVSDLRDRRKKEIESNLRDVVDTMIDNMICKMESKGFIRGAYYFATQLLTRAYHQGKLCFYINPYIQPRFLLLSVRFVGIHVSSEEVLRLRSVAEEASRKKQSIIFLPCHKSHVDYVSLQLICYRLGIALPVIVAGDNLNFPAVGPFLQHAGMSYYLLAGRNQF